MIRASARETDVVARFGGDEFALILPDTGSDGALAVGERIRERIAAHEFLHGDGFDMHLTVSVGVATLPDVGDDRRSADPGRRRGDVLREGPRQERHPRRGHVEGMKARARFAQRSVRSRF